MGVVIIDGSTVLAFVNDKCQFEKSVKEAFAALDINKDGVLSRSELLHVIETLRLIDSHFGVDVATPPEELMKLYDWIFEKFDGDHSGTVDHEEFKDEIRNMLLAIADGLGFSPVQMAIEEDDKYSFLKQAVDLEASKFSG